MSGGFDERWEAIHASRAWGTTPNEHLVRYVRKIKSSTGKKALDVGCGAGAQSRHLFNEGFDVTGIDGSASAIDRCLDIAQDGLRFNCGDVTEMSFDDATFDLAVDVCCTQHILRPLHWLALGQILRVLKPGGKFFSVTAKWDHSESKDTPLRRMRTDEARTLFEQTGFHITSVDKAQYSLNNGSYWVSHWIIAMEKA